eukprot:5285018-Pyramimonas_sp.AAC.1
MSRKRVAVCCVDWLELPHRRQKLIPRAPSERGEEITCKRCRAIAFIGKVRSILRRPERIRQRQSPG